MVETVPLQLAGEWLEVNVDAGTGSLTVEVLSGAGEPLPGFTREDCQAVDTDGVRQTVRWRGDARLPARPSPFACDFIFMMPGCTAFAAGKRARREGDLVLR